MAHVHAPGLVLRLDPVELRKQGASCSREFDAMANAQHYFVCIGVDAKQGYWVPLSGTATVGSQAIPATAKTGDRRWADVPSFYQPDQCWCASHKAVQRAAAAAHDRTDAKMSNRVAADALPDPGDFPAISGQ